MGKKVDLRVHFPRWITRMFPSAIWYLPKTEKTLYLTFDDGPIPEVTPQVLEILDAYDIKATFFCVGDNVTKYPELYQEVLKKGHSVGNHTHNHIQGLKTSNHKYLRNIETAGKYIKSNLFRPPHGSLKRMQYHSVIRKYKLIMWDVISCDYDPRLTPDQCFSNVIDFVRNGSIITFHDSIKAKKNVLETLPRCIDYLLNEGYKFEKIEFKEEYPLKIKSSPKHLKSLKYNINRLLKGA